MMLKFRFVAVLLGGLLVAHVALGASTPKHALAKAVKALVVTAPKAAPSVAKRSLKDTIGSIAFATESVVDVVHYTTDALDKGVAAEGFKQNPFHYVNIVVGDADTGLEKAEQFFFGTSN